MKIGLGTVQFGRPYGVSNAGGQPPENVVADILRLAGEKGIGMLDTAPGYGEAEAVLGRAMPDGNAFDIVTKTCVLRDMAGAETPADAVRHAFEGSLKRLKRDRLYGLMAHLADDLLGPHGDEVWAAMEGIKSRGLITRIGTCCYTGAELRTLVARYPIEIVQVPLNAFDQRLIVDGTLAALKERGIEIHARSAFLQGLLLMDPDALPEGFTSAEPSVRAFRNRAESLGLSPLQLALRFSCGLSYVDRVICGVTNVRELTEIIAAVAATPTDTNDLQDLAVDKEAIITPSSWPPDNERKWDFRYETKS